MTINSNEYTHSAEPNFKASAGKTGGHPAVLMDALFKDLPKELGDLCESMSSVRTALQEHIASKFENALKKYLASKHFSSLEERKEFALWLGDLTQKLGLTIVCPTTGKPGFLLAMMNELTDPPQAQYFFSSDYGVIQSTSVELPELRIVPASEETKSFVQRFRKNNLPSR